MEFVHGVSDGEKSGHLEPADAERESVADVGILLGGCEGDCEIGWAGATGGRNAGFQGSNSERERGFEVVIWTKEREMKMGID